MIHNDNININLWITIKIYNNINIHNVICIESVNTNNLDFFFPVVYILMCL